MTSYQQEIDHVKSYTSQLAKEIPDIMKGFYALSKAGSASGSLDTKTKELIALAIGVATHCDGCIKPHPRADFKTHLRTPPRKQNNSKHFLSSPKAETLARRGCEVSDEFASFGALWRRVRNWHIVKKF